MKYSESHKLLFFACLSIVCLCDHVIYMFNGLELVHNFLSTI